MAQNALVGTRPEPRRRPNWLMMLLAVSIAVNLALGAFLVIRQMGLAPASSAATDFNRSSYYAVFLNNKEAFVGHITDVGADNLSMSDLFYLTFDPPVDASGKPVANASPNDYKPALKKLGQEVWGPKDFVRINRSNMEYYTELRPDSPIVKAIVAFQTKK